MVFWFSDACFEKPENRPIYQMVIHMPENAGQMQVSGEFQKGQSGNPNGKAKGTKNRATLTAERLLQGDLVVFVEGWLKRL